MWRKRKKTNNWRLNIQPKHIKTGKIEVLSSVSIVSSPYQTCWKLCRIIVRKLFKNDVLSTKVLWTKSFSKIGNSRGMWFPIIFLSYDRGCRICICILWPFNSKDAETRFWQTIAFGHDSLVYFTRSVDFPWNTCEELICFLKPKWNTWSMQQRSNFPIIAKRAMLAFSARV